MLTLPFTLTNLIVGFAPLFSKPVWKHAQVWNCCSDRKEKRIRSQDYFFSDGLGSPILIDACVHRKLPNWAELYLLL